MKTLSQIIPPHAPMDAALLASLTLAYECGILVPPIVVMEVAGYLLALCGSHRIAAMRAVYYDDTAIDDLVRYVLVVDGDDLYERCPDAREYLDRLRADRFDFDADLACLRAYLDAETLAALEGQ